MRDAGGEEVQRGAGVGLAVTRVVRRQRLAGAQIGADQERIDDPGRGPGIGDALVASRRHTRQRERGAAQNSRERRHFLDVTGGVPPDALRIAAVLGVDAVARDVHAIARGDAKVTRNGLQPAPGQVAGREPIPHDGVHGVDQLASRRDVTDAPSRILLVGDPAARRTLPQAPPDASERQRHAEAPGTPRQERQVEAMEVVVLDDVGIRGRDPAHEGADQPRFGGVAVALRLEDVDHPGWIAHRDHEDAIGSRVQTGGLEVELQAVKSLERKVAEVRAPGRDQVLLLGRQHEHALLAEVFQPAQAPSVFGVHHEAERTGALERAIAVMAGGRTERVERVEQDPRCEPDVLAHEQAGRRIAAPHDCASIPVRPHRHDSRGRIPARITHRPGESYRSAVFLQASHESRTMVRCAGSAIASQSGLI
jgi:hypothetical protein